MVKINYLLLTEIQFMNNKINANKMFYKFIVNLALPWKRMEKTGFT